MPRVNPEILRWARETAGLSQLDAAQKLGIKAARGLEPEDRISLLESGTNAPSISVLRKMAKHYRRPLITFYLSKPPARGERGEDFRMLPDAEQGAAGPLVEALLRDIKARQDMVRTLLLDDEPPELAFVGSMKMSDGVDALARAIIEELKFDLKQFRQQRSEEEAFSYLRKLAESQGVFVVLAGNLGSHHTSIDVKVFRGFALADNTAPFVVINDQDAKSAWAFTLVHELTHLWLGQSGISGEKTETQIESFCSDVASQFLLPDIADFAVSNQRATLQDTVGQVARFARERRISASMVCYRLFLVGFLREQEWRRISGLFREMWLEGREARRERARLSERGPNYYVVKRHRIGGALLTLVGRGLAEGLITHTKAGKLLGVKARSVAPLLNHSGTTPWAA